MPAQISFDKVKDHSHAISFANNLKIALAIEYATKDLKLTINDDSNIAQLVVSDSYQLFNPNAILRYALNDFTDQESEANQFAVTIVEKALISSETSSKEVVTKTLEQYLPYPIEEPVSATKLILLADILALDPTTVKSKFTALPEKILKAIIEAEKATPRSPSMFKNTGAVNVEQNFKVKQQAQEIVPEKGERNILITSALPYVNNVPHLGNIVGSVLSADIFARYCKTRNYNTLFVCGTDEYGTATETKALEEGCTPRELCDKYHKIHSDVYKWFQIGFDYFGRTTTEQQTEIAQDIFKKLDKNGYLEEQSMKQLYCPVHNSYLADRYVEGECPKCHYEDARGDQCDKCGGLLDPFELINPRCKLDNATPIPKFSDHIFLSLDKLEPSIAKWVEKSSEEGQWSKNSKTITNSWLKDGLKPRCITRDLVWGTPVPLEKYKDKVLYVWFDATIGYVSITANYTKKWEQWWKDPENVKLYQFMGKDNVPFHTVVFPGSQLGTGDEWTMLHHLNTTEYLQYEGGKFSKSRGVGVFGNNAQDSGVSPSVWRYYLASVRPESSDSHFSWDDFVARNNSELLANLGNFVNRLIKFVNAKYNGVVPKYDHKQVPNYDGLKKDIDVILKSYVEKMEYGHERSGLELAMSLSARGNLFLQENKLDNSLFSQFPAKSDAVVGVGLNIIYTVTSLIYPFMPETAEKIYKMLNAPALKIDEEFHLAILEGHNINKAEYLFHRIDEKQVEQWRNLYGGKQV
ncbi:methionine--tRNA ligase MES1 NDAI_0C03590 [Naumovozyma dairenensis CBS 421]|uniref:methionine--tRNA ligase n=1 Tax=Naumovozyma dairenensis (strain ATCC 10597 / BCRC 20456 / CBS 421 / NBRC 0211 / NRRL Y-12639) TaxID=1071378 RepID=G0W8A8_NAUDC|nr:hypothetical protein NDAI_0C03590 [Naumovozyma dairenensis CBS 421]CCD24019.1 hypothetical protein NDAI_0C03590 [Naumovozyma dairenensis CBS 421]